MESKEKKNTELKFREQIDCYGGRGWRVSKMGVKKYKLGAGGPAHWDPGDPHERRLRPATPGPGQKIKKKKKNRNKKAHTLGNK